MKRLPTVGIALLGVLILSRAWVDRIGGSGAVEGSVASTWIGLADWCLALVALGWIVHPLVRGPLRRLPDQGWFFARWFGLLFVGWAGWMSSILHWAPFWPWGVGTALIGGGALSVVYSRRRTRGIGLGTGEENPTSRAWILGGEVLFWGVFALLLLSRYLNPDLVHPTMGGEKPMELAILNAVLRSPWLPPTDPWLAGHVLNYYYFGYVPFALLTRLTGLPASIGFNLAVPTVGAMAAVACWIAVGTLVRSAPPSFEALREPLGRKLPQPLLRSLWGPFLLLGIGNLYEAKLLASGFRRLGESVGGVSTLPMVGGLVDLGQGLGAWLFQGASWPYSLTSLYWSATRVIPHAPSEAAPISEFPLFSLLFADLHPHLIALPGLLFLLLAVLAMKRGEQEAQVSVGGAWTGSLLLGIALGWVLLVNPWDLPLAVLLTVLGSLLFLARRGSWAFLPLSGLSLIVGVATALPFFLTYDSPAGAVRFWHGSGTPLSAFLWIHGLFVFIALSWLIRRILRTERSLRGNGFGKSWGGWAAAVILLLAPVAVWTGRISGALWLATAFAAALLAFVGWGRPRSRQRAIAALLLLGCVLTAVPEFLVLEGDVGRMNLVFKLYFEVWCLWSVACAACLCDLFGESSSLWPPRIRATWSASLLLLVAASLLFPLLAFPARAADRIEGAARSGLDGLDTLATARYSLGDRTLELRGGVGAIRWLERDTRGQPVILEAATDDYGLGGRISSATGLPTIIGWPAHERQQRRAQSIEVEIARRLSDVKRLYTAIGSEEILPLIERYNVRFIIVGDLERVLYGTRGPAKFEHAVGVYWDRVWAGDDTVIYRVR